MPRELDSCVRKVRAKGKAQNPFAVCRASLGTDAEIKARRKVKRRPSGSGVFTDAEISKGFRKLETPTLRSGQKSIAFPGVPKT